MDSGREGHMPHIYIAIENGEPMETRDKRRQLNAVVRVEGKQNYSSYEGDCTIQGRGNSTWGMPGLHTLMGLID